MPIECVFPVDWAAFFEAVAVGWLGYVMVARSFVSLKAFGDLVIAVAVLERLSGPGAGGVEILYGSHLSDLVSALEPRVAARRIQLASTSVPAMYDVRKAGLPRALASLAEVRAALARSAPEQGVLVFDRNQARERIIAGRLAHRALPVAGNIYDAYDLALREFGLEPGSVLSGTAYRGGTIGLFTASRVARKDIPLELLEPLIARLNEAGAPSIIYLLEGERPDITASHLPHVVIPRTFGALIGAVRECSLVVSADSLPAHLAEREGLPVYVLSPASNEFWLPRSSFVHRNWGLFSDGTPDAIATKILGMRAA